MKLSASRAALCSLALSSMLVACGDGHDEFPWLVESNMAVPIAPVNTDSVMNTVAGRDHRFAAGVAVFGTLSPTTVKFFNGAGGATFQLTSGTATAGGQFNPASCTFYVTLSGFPADSALGQGKTVSVTPCTLALATKGLTGDSTPLTVSGTVALGTSVSDAGSYALTIDRFGKVTSAAGQIGQVNLLPTSPK